jgi:hypothetical protein
MKASATATGGITKAATVGIKNWFERGQSPLYSSMRESTVLQEKKIGGEQLSILSSIGNEIQGNWDNTYMNAKYNPGSVFQGVMVNKRKPEK